MERESGYYWAKRFEEVKKEIILFYKSGNIERTGYTHNYKTEDFFWIDKPENRIPEPKEEE